MLLFTLKIWRNTTVIPFPKDNHCWNLALFLLVILFLYIFMDLLPLDDREHTVFAAWLLPFNFTSSYMSFMVYMHIKAAAFHLSPMSATQHPQGLEVVWDLTFPISEKVREVLWEDRLCRSYLCLQHWNPHPGFFLAAKLLATLWWEMSPSVLVRSYDLQKLLG